MLQNIQKRHYMQVTHPISVSKKPRINSRNKMVLQNHSVDQNKSFRKLLNFRTWLCLPCIVHLNMPHLTCEFLCFTSLFVNVSSCNKPTGLSFSGSKASCWKRITLVKLALRLQINRLWLGLATYCLHFYLVVRGSFANLYLLKFNET